MLCLAESKLLLIFEGDGDDYCFLPLFVEETDVIVVGMSFT